MRSSVVMLLILCAQIATAQQWQQALPGYQYQFPRDYFDHPAYQTEWWYYTGNLRAKDGHRYGFELTFFREGVHVPQRAAASEDPTWTPKEIYLAHLALSDIDGKTFYHTERLNRAGPGLAGASLAAKRYWNGNWDVRWTQLPGTTQRLRAVCDRFTLELNLQPEKPAVIHGRDGVSQKGPQSGEASHYISFTRIAVNGTLERNGFTDAVNGLAWMDHEYFSEALNQDLVSNTRKTGAASSSPSEEQRGFFPASRLVSAPFALAGWDWFAIQLDNNEELMLYRLRTKSGEKDQYSSGTFVDATGRSHFLSASEFVLTPSEVWHSTQSGANYPVSWKISVPALQLKLTEQTALDDQELDSRNSISPSYWEGAVTYNGQIAGHAVNGLGYLEMTGYGRPLRFGQ